MPDAAALAWRQYRLERRMFWRNPTAAFFNFVLPLLFLTLFGAIFSRCHTGDWSSRSISTWCCAK